MVLVDKMCSLPNQLSLFARRSDLLPELFKQSSEEYLFIALRTQSSIDRNGIPHEHLFLREYSMNNFGVLAVGLETIEYLTAG